MLFPGLRPEKEVRLSANSRLGYQGDMPTPDDFSTYLTDLLSGTYDRVDRISLRGYYPMGQTSGGLLTWWNQLHPGVPLTAEQLRRMAGDFGRRVNAYATKHAIPIHYCELGDKTKHARAEKLRPQDPNFQGVFLILVAKAPALVWQAKPNRHGNYDTGAAVAEADAEELIVREGIRPQTVTLLADYGAGVVAEAFDELTARAAAMLRAAAMVSTWNG